MSVVPQVGGREDADCRIRYFSSRRIISEVRLPSLEGGAKSLKAKKKEGDTLLGPVLRESDLVGLSRGIFHKLPKQGCKGNGGAHFSGRGQFVSSESRSLLAQKE